VGDGRARDKAGVKRAPVIATALMTGFLLSCGIGTSGTTSSLAPVRATTQLISRNVPVYASSELYPARNANDGDYSTVWRGSIPGWIAYDLSRVPAARRARVIVAWFNDPLMHEGTEAGLRHAEVVAHRVAELS
jgi:hypothetical protein